MKLLGLRVCEHDSNFTYYDGHEVYYHKSEREYGIKHLGLDNIWSWKNEIKRIWNISYKDIDEIGIVCDPWRYNFPIDEENFFPEQQYKYILFNNHVTRVNHHYAHALSCWPIEKEKSEVQIVIDGYGDDNIAWSVFKNNQLIQKGDKEKHGSIGLYMSKVANLFNIQGHPLDVAGKVMALQSFGTVDEGYTNILKNYNMTNVKEIFNFNNWITYNDDETISHLRRLDWIRTVHEYTGHLLVNFFKEYSNGYETKISYSGGVALNVVWNTQLKEKFKNLVIPPHCADEGLSLGVIEYLRLKNNLDPFVLKNFPYVQNDETPENEADQRTIKKTVSYLKEGKIVAWYQGHGEIGPRALGHRSILINPQIKNAKKLINKIKKREKYRPFGASVLRENVNIESPFMLYLYSITSPLLHSITHIDNTCRIQTVDKSEGTYYNLLKEFYKETGCPFILNTSLNINGKPIVGKKQEIINFFNESEIDVLVMGNETRRKEYVF